MLELTADQLEALARERARLERDLDLPAGTLTFPVSTAPEFVPGFCGSIGGYQSVCTCGLVMGSSMLSSVVLDRRAHAVYHDQQTYSKQPVRRGRI